MNAAGVEAPSGQGDVDALGLELRIQAELAELRLARCIGGLQRLFGSIGRLASALEVDQPQLRATLAASTLIGMAMLRYVIKVEPLASARPAVVAGWLGPTVQRYLTDPGVTARPRATGAGG